MLCRSSAPFSGSRKKLVIVAVMMPRKPMPTTERHGNEPPFRGHRAYYP